jgi:hypothetical protein
MVRVLIAPPRIPTLQRFPGSRRTSSELRGCSPWAMVSAMTSFGLQGRFGAFVSVRKIPFPGNRDFGSKRRGSKSVSSEEEGRVEPSQTAKSRRGRPATNDSSRNRYSSTGCVRRDSPN